MGSASDDAFAAGVYEVLKQIRDPDLGKDIVSLGFVKNLRVKKTLLGKRDLSFEIELTTPACPVKDEFQREALRLVRGLEGVGEVRVTMSAQVRKDAGEHAIEGVRSVVLVASGKGGVGKSTVAVNLALALQKLGARVGLLDADIYGPSQALMLGLSGSPRVRDGKILPMEGPHGLAVMTFAFFAPVGEAVIWRGPQIGKAVQEMLHDVDWRGSASNTERRDLDYLVVDTPPGTGDVHLSLAHSAKITGAVLVSTPQEVALIDTVKGRHMFRKMNIPVLGIVENMSGFLCTKCGTRHDLFGSGGAQRMAEKEGLPFLGAIPLYPEVRVSSDEGRPIVDQNVDHPVSREFIRIAGELARELSKATSLPESTS